MEKEVDMDSFPCKYTIQMYSANDLTDKQAAILKYLQKVRQDEGNSPTYREIADHFNFKSAKAAADHVRALEKKGRVRLHAGRSRGIEVLRSDLRSLNSVVSVPVLGNIPAGSPEDRSDQQYGSLAVDVALLGGSRDHRLFALLIRGDSMVGHGIREGDWVVADADLPPRVDNVVVALIDGENTLKVLAQQDGQFYLKAANPDYPDLVPIRELMIQGVAKILIKKLS